MSDVLRSGWLISFSLKHEDQSPHAVRYTYVQGEKVEGWPPMPRTYAVAIEDEQEAVDAVLKKIGLSSTSERIQNFSTQPLTVNGLKGYDEHIKPGQIVAGIPEE